MKEVSNRTLFLVLIFAVVIVVAGAFLIFNAANEIEYSSGEKNTAEQHVSTPVGYITLNVPEEDGGEYEETQ